MRKRTYLLRRPHPTPNRQLEPVGPRTRVVEDVLGTIVSGAARATTEATAAAVRVARFGAEERNMNDRLLEAPRPSFPYRGAGHKRARSQTLSST